MKDKMLLSVVFMLVGHLSSAQFALNTKGRVFTEPVAYKYHRFSMIYCDSSTFEAETIFYGVNSSSKAVFTNANFKEKCSFQGSVFRKGADFSYSVFRKKVDFGHLSATDTLNFSSASFGNTALFWVGSFNGLIDFTSCNFGGDAVFMDSSLKEAVFNGTTFSGEVRFDNSIISGSLTIQNIEVNEDIGFEKAHLGKNLLLKDFKTDGVLNFRGAILPDTLKLINVQLGLPLDLDNCTAKGIGPCLLYLEDVDVSKLWIDFRYVQLWLPENVPISRMEYEEYFKDLLHLEKARKRKESYNALKKQHKEFLRS